MRYKIELVDSSSDSVRAARERDVNTFKRLGLGGRGTCFEGGGAFQIQKLASHRALLPLGQIHSFNGNVVIQMAIFFVHSDSR